LPTGHRDAFQLQHVLLEHEVRRILRGAQANGLTLVPQQAGKHRDFTIGHTKPELTALIGAHTQLLPDDAYRRIGERLTRDGHGDLAGHIPTLRVGAKRHDGDKRHGRQQSLQPAHE
jgi:hypothetical protein